MIETLINIDQSLFEFVNSTLSNPVFDYLLPLFRNKYFWIPLYVFILSFLIINYKRKGLLIMAIAICTIGVTDFTSSVLIKKNVERLRPCNDLEIKNSVILRIECGSGFSFTSSHAANHFALATFLILSIFNRHKWPFLIWASLISISQVYVGVHYPFDIIVGALLGIFIGWLMSIIYKRLILHFQKPRLTA